MKISLLILLTLMVSTSQGGQRSVAQVKRSKYPMPLGDYFFSLTQDEYRKMDELIVTDKDKQPVCTYHTDVGERLSSLNPETNPLKFSADPGRYFIITWSTTSAVTPWLYKILDVTKQDATKSNPDCTFIKTFAAQTLNLHFDDDELQIQEINTVKDSKESNYYKDVSVTTTCVLNAKKNLVCEEDEVRPSP